MELIGSLLLVLAVAVLVAIFISKPFLQGAAQGVRGADQKLVDAAQEREHQRSALLAERDRVLNALQELDFDNALGKIPEDEYPLQRAALMKTGADTLRRLDTFQSEADTSGSAEDRIEAAVAARRADASAHRAQAAAAVTNGSSKQKDDLEELIASRKRERKETSVGFCPRCGKPVQKSDKFCSKCGTTL